MVADFGVDQETLDIMVASLMMLKNAMVSGVVDKDITEIVLTHIMVADVVVII
jgi:hypothetical protein